MLDLFTTVDGARGFALRTSERERLQTCEDTIGRGLQTFVDVGGALLEIRENRLYRGTHRTFEDYCRERWGMSKPYATQVIGAAQVVGNLVAIATTVPANEAQARPLTALPPDQQREAWTLAVETAPNGKVTAAHVQEVVDSIVAPVKAHVAHNSGNNEWYTPPEYIAAARAVLGEIDLDPASSDIANGIIGAAHYFTAEQNGLLYEWGGHVWMNPPYAAELVGKFCDKLVSHFVAGDVPDALVLVNNATETGWFQAMLSQASAVCFVKRRVKFLDPEGNPGAPLQGQAILYFGQCPEAFAAEFGEYGAILYGDTPWRHSQS